jgi:hypothetical protein
MHTGTHEQTINTALGEVLQQFGREMEASFREYREDF